MTRGLHPRVMPPWPSLSHLLAFVQTLSTAFLSTCGVPGNPDLLALP